MMIEITTASISDRGLNPQKSVNEDSFLVMPQEGLFAVADGVGGAYAGDVASQSALSAVKEMVLHKQKQAIRSQPDVIEFITSLIDAGNEAIYNIAQKEQQEMASTIVLMAVESDYAVLGHVGDSRVYMLRSGKLHQLTKDHSKLQDMLDSVPKQSRDKMEFIQSHIITKALGVAPTVEADLQKVFLKHGDVFVLCTDGIYNHNTDAEILNNLNKNKNNLDKVCEVFKETCYQKGANDHLTAVVLRIARKSDDLARTRRISQDHIDTILKR